MSRSSSVRPVRRRSLLRGMAAGAGAALLASCGQEPSGTAGATNGSPTPAPTRAVVVSTPLTAIPPRPV